MKEKKSLSPHLPPDSCNIMTHYRMQSLWKVLFIVFIGCLSGITAAFVAVAWILPQTGSVPTLGTFGGNNRSDANEKPSVLLVQQTKQRLMTIYDKRKKIDGVYYPEHAVLSDAILLSSDGWAVVYDPDKTLPDTSVWEGVDHQGVTHQVVRFVRDPMGQLLYVQFSGEGFRIVSFAPTDAYDTDATLWSMSGDDWQRVYGDTLVRQKLADSYTLYAPQYALRVLPLQAKKSILLSDQGELFGLVDANGTVLPSWWIDYELNSLLKHGVIRYEAVPWKGSFITRTNDVEVTKEILGFYVESGAGRAVTSVRNSDLVIAFNGKPIDRVHTARDIFSLPDEFSVTVLRDGVELTVTAKKTEVK